MSRVGRAAAIGGLLLAVVAITAWDRGSPQVSNAVSLDGHALFRAKACASCHDGPDSTASVSGFPSLRDADGWAGQRRAEMSARAYLAESIAEPGAFVSPAFPGGNGPTLAMPYLAVSSDEVDALVDYLLSN